jgi:hypothetical protein
MICSRVLSSGAFFLGVRSQNPGAGGLGSGTNRAWRGAALGRTLKISSYSFHREEGQNIVLTQAVSGYYPARAQVYRHLTRRHNLPNKR